MSCPSKTCYLDPVLTRLVIDGSELLALAITSMINRSISTGTLPSSWKETLFLPSFKSAKKGLIKENYRPFFVSKICEKVVGMQFTNHILNNNLMEPFQLAYRTNYSTETALGAWL